VGADHKWECRPPKHRTLTTLCAMEDKIEQTFLASNRPHPEPPSFLPFEDGLPATTMWTSNNLFVHFGSENYCVSQKTGSSVLNTFEPESMVQYRRGHDSDLLRTVRLPSNNTDGPCHVHFLFSKTIQVRVSRKTPKTRRTRQRPRCSNVLLSDRDLDNSNSPLLSFPTSSSPASQSEDHPGIHQKTRGRRQTP
jgi:hypothetical protein